MNAIRTTYWDPTVIRGIDCFGSCSAAVSVPVAAAMSDEAAGPQEGQPLVAAEGERAAPLLRRPFVLCGAAIAVIALGVGLGLELHDHHALGNLHLWPIASINEKRFAVEQDQPVRELVERNFAPLVRSGEPANLGLPWHRQCGVLPERERART